MSDPLGDADTISGARALPTDPEGETLPHAAATALPQTFRKGTELGHFVIERALGRGAMGVVYAARDTRLDRLVAIKLVLGEIAGSIGSERRKRLEREAHALARLSHPNVISVFEIGEHAGQLYIVMELVDGATLGETLAGIPASDDRWRAVVTLLLAASEGLAAAHAAGLVHRDFKPDNVLVDRAGRLRVMDFGVAQDAGVAAVGDGGRGVASVALTQTGAMVGTPAYMSPEQLRAVEVDARSDQFAFGVVLYEALFGRRPFVAPSLPELVAVVLDGEPPRFDGAPCPRAIVDVMRRALARDPAERFPDMQSLAAALRAALERREAQPPRRWPLGVAALGLAVAVAFFALRREPTPPAAEPELERATFSGTGTLAPDKIRAVVKERIGDLHECYEQTVATYGFSTGRVVIRAIIGVAGNVESANVDVAQPGDPFLGSCVAARMMGWRFPAPEGGSVEIRYPFTFEPG